MDDEHFRFPAVARAVNSLSQPPSGDRSVREAQSIQANKQVEKLSCSERRSSHTHIHTLSAGSIFALTIGIQLSHSCIHSLDLPD